MLCGYYKSFNNIFKSSVLSNNDPQGLSLDRVIGHNMNARPENGYLYIQFYNDVASIYASLFDHSYSCTTVTYFNMVFNRLKLRHWPFSLHAPCLF